MQQYSSGASLKMAMANDRTKARHDRAANTEGFHEGQLVLLYNPQKKKALYPKLQTSWNGPYEVVKRLNDVVYRIQKTGSPLTKMKVVPHRATGKVWENRQWNTFGTNRLRWVAVLRKDLIIV